MKILFFHQFILIRFEFVQVLILGFQICFYPTRFTIKVTQPYLNALGQPKLLQA